MVPDDGKGGEGGGKDQRGRYGMEPVAEVRVVEGGLDEEGGGGNEEEEAQGVRCAWSGERLRCTVEPAEAARLGKKQREKKRAGDERDGQEKKLIAERVVRECESIQLEIEQEEDGDEGTGAARAGSCGRALAGEVGGRGEIAG